MLMFLRCCIPPLSKQTEKKRNRDETPDRG